jgi:hypothetical protein
MHTPFSTLLLAIVLGFSATLNLEAAPVDARVFSVSGKVEAAPPGSTEFAQIREGQTLKDGTMLRTASDGRATVVTTPGSAVRIEPDTQLTLNEMAFETKNGKIAERRARIDLQSGTVSALIDRKTPNVTDFKVRTPQGIAAARGTFFAVSADKSQTYVAVREGKVGAAGLKDGKKKH